MENIVTILTILFGLFKLSTELVLTKPAIVGMRGTKVTIECKYMSTDRWYIMQWKRIYKDREPVTLTTLQNNGKTETAMPIWENEVDEDFKTRARTSVFVDITSVVFNLSIHEFSCNDTGNYVCMVLGAKNIQNSTELSIAAKPGSPTVVDDEVILEINDTYTLECSAMAGIPAADLKWYYKVPGSKEFRVIINESKQDLIELNDCSKKAIHRIEVMINKETDGIIYRCQVESYLLDKEESQSFYDDVILKLPMKVIPPQPEYRMPLTTTAGTNASNVILANIVSLTIMLIIARLSGKSS